MTDPVLFFEKQRFTQWWIWLILAGVNAMLVYGVIRQVIFDKPFGSKPASNEVLILIAALCLILLFVFLNFRLETIIKKDGIYVRFYPFHIKFRHYNWSEISKAYVRKYSPLKEFGGWGVRFGYKGNALNMSGNQGLQLEFTTRKNLLIGTRRPGEVASVLNKVQHPSVLHSQGS